jgi:uncharacterized protein (DUF2237 family)
MYGPRAEQINRGHRVGIVRELLVTQLRQCDFWCACAEWWRPALRKKRHPKIVKIPAQLSNSG